MASATPDLRLPSQSHDIAAPATGTKLYSLVTDVRVWTTCPVERPEVELATSRVASQRHNH